LSAAVSNGRNRLKIDQVVKVFEKVLKTFPVRSELEWYKLEKAILIYSEINNLGLNTAANYLKIAWAFQNPKNIAQL